MTARLVDDEAVSATLEMICSGRIPPIDQDLREQREALELLPAQNACPKKERRPEPIPIRNIALFVTQQCNLRCIYCYGDGGGYGSGGEMTRETARQAVDWIIKQSRKVKRLTIRFFGGEPLLNFPLIRDVVQYARERGAACGKEFSFTITTNASLLDDEKIAFLKDQQIEPFVSLDGPRDVQDRQRPFGNGKGSYEAIVPKIKKLLAVLPETACRATVVGSTDPVRVDTFLRELGFRRRYLRVASRSLFHGGPDRFRSGRDLAGMRDKAEDDSRQLLAAIRERDTDKLLDARESEPLWSFVEQFVNSRKRYRNCGAGKGLVAVSCSGDVYLCHRFVGLAEYRLGSVFTGDLEREMYLTRFPEHHEACTGCCAKYLCAGGCYHDNLGSTGSVFGLAEDMCALMRRWAELSAAISTRLTQPDKAYLVKEGIMTKKPCPIDLY